MKKTSVLILALLVHAGAFAAPSTVAPMASQPAAPAVVWPNGDTVATLTPTQKQFLAWSAATRKAKFDDAEYRAFVGAKTNGWCRPQPQLFRWTGDGACTVTVFRASDNRVHFTAVSATNAVFVDNFEIGQDYRWTVANAGGTSAGTFATEAQAPRLLRDPDPERRIFGVRDLGGRTGLGGLRVRQNLVFRTSEFNYKQPPEEDPTAPGESFVTDANRGFWLDELGVRTDLDLRSSEEAQNLTGSPLGATVAWRHIEASSYKSMLTTAWGRTAFAQCFELFLETNNYPIAFHCVAGQDRTGSLAYILNGVLGVDEDELMKDWEATIFWNRSCDASSGYWLHKYIEPFVTQLKTYPGADVGAQCCYWVTNVCGISSAKLEKFRTLMLDGYPPKPTPVAPPETFDYLETDGVGYLLTDCVPDGLATRLEMKVQFLDNAANQPLFHASAVTAGGSTVGDFMAATYFPNLSSSNPYFNYYNALSPSSLKVRFGTGFTDTNAVHTLAFGGNAASLDGAEATSGSAAAGAMPGPLAFFAGSYGGTFEIFARVRCYGAKVWSVSGGVTNLVHDYCACTNAAGVATLWDAVSGECLAVKGGGVFRAGNGYPSSAYPSWIDSRDAKSRQKYDTWSAKYDVTDPSAAKQSAYLLNCDNTETAIKEAKDEFLIRGITVGSDGTVTIDPPDGDYNGNIRIGGDTDVKGGYTLEPSDSAARFFRAFLD